MNKGITKLENINIENLAITFLTKYSNEILEKIHVILDNVDKFSVAYKFLEGIKNSDIQILLPKCEQDYYRKTRRITLKELDDILRSEDSCNVLTELYMGNKFTTYYDELLKDLDNFAYDVEYKVINEFLVKEKLESNDEIFDEIYNILDIELEEIRTDFAEKCIGDNNKKLFEAIKWNDLIKNLDD